MNEVLRMSMRRREVLRLIADGASNREIAEALTISLSTVRGYVVDVMTVLGARNRAHAVAIGHQKGLL